MNYDELYKPEYAPKALPGGWLGFHGLNAESDHEVIRGRVRTSAIQAIGSFDDAENLCAITVVMGSQVAKWAIFGSLDDVFEAVSQTPPPEGLNKP